MTDLADRLRRNGAFCQQTRVIAAQERLRRAMEAAV